MGTTNTKTTNSMNFKTLLKVLKNTIQGFMDDNITKLSGSLAYFTMFSLAPFFVILINVGIYFDDKYANRIYTQLSAMLGSDVSQQLQEVVSRTAVSNNSVLATIIGIGVIIFSSTAIFSEIQSSLNTVWGIKPKPKKGWLKFLKNRLISFSMILTLGFILLITFSVTSMLHAFNEHLFTLFPDAKVYLIRAGSFLLNFLISWILFSLIFSILPDAKIKIKDVAVGALVTTILFTLGQFGISAYLSTNKTISAYGAAGSLLLLLSWVYYSAMILYLGAEFTKAWADEMGGKIYPDEYAVSTRIIEVEKEDKPVEVINKETVAHDEKAQDKIKKA